LALRGPLFNCSSVCS